MPTDGRTFSPRAPALSFMQIALAAALLLAPLVLQAEVARVEIASRQDVLGGKPFGNAGAYEKLTGKVYFAVDPSNPHNQIIADLGKAPRDAAGKVEFSADLFILAPKDASKANGVLLFDVINRGNLQTLTTFNRAARSNDPTTDAEFGDGLLMREGYTVVAVGWQFDVPHQNHRIGFQAPIATDNGKPIAGWVSPWFIPGKASESYQFTGEYNTPDYPPLDPKDPSYRLTVREGFVAAPRLIPREDWQFGRMQNGAVVFDANWISVKGGFRPGLTYELTYQTQNPPVAGLGLAALRDMASALKYNRDVPVHGRYVYTYGASQIGRLQRQMIYQGFTTDEQGRQAIDALFVQTGGTSMGSFNERFAVPNELGSFTQTMFPIRYETLTDPATGRRDGLGIRVPAGEEPKIFLVDTGSEYWDRGRVAALRHLSLDGTQDLADPPNVRVYMLAGTKHSAGTWPPADDGGQLKSNPNDYRWAQRGLLEALDRWVRQGTAPPPSLHPQLSDRSLVAHSGIRYPEIPGVQWPYHVPGGYRIDLRGPFAVLPFLVPQVDSDGNDIGGIRLPEQAVPLGTYTDWNFRSERLGASDTIIAMAGGYIPFALTRAEREKNHDPRLSIEERYKGRADYLGKVKGAADRLAQQGYILRDDVKPIVDLAGQHWDWTMGAKAATGGN